MDTILDVSHLSVHFGHRDVLRDLSFNVERGSSLAILGPNGAGKTVLFRSLVGATPFAGTVRWAPDTRIGYVPQKLDLERDIPITGLDFLTARTALARGSRTDIARVLALVGIPPDVANQPIGVLSGGQFQRLLLAFALVGDPNVLLLDEPTAGIDEPGQQQINELVSVLQTRSRADRAVYLARAHRGESLRLQCALPEPWRRMLWSAARHSHAGSPA